MATVAVEVVIDINTAIGPIAIAIGLIAALALGNYIGMATATKDTIAEAQRAAVKQGAARWSSNRETGEAQFDFIQCLKPEAK